MSIAELQSGKGHKDENFPVASVLIAPKHRPAVMAFNRFVRTSDDIADRPQRHAAFREIAVWGCAMPFRSDTDDYGQSLADMATPLGPALGWHPAGT